jgi:hypothetical protein
MIVPDLQKQLYVQLDLLKNLVEKNLIDLKCYPDMDYGLSALPKLEHTYNTLLSLTDLLSDNNENNPG